MQTEARDKVGIAVAAIQLAWHALADLAEYIDGTPETEDGITQEEQHGTVGAMWMLAHLGAALLQTQTSYGFSPIEEGSAAYERLRDRLQKHPQRWRIRD
jgi:hypothetical protein